MKKIFISLLLLALCKSGFSQKDSTIIYLNKDGKVTTADSAFTYGFFSKNGNLWHCKVLYTSNKSLQSEGDYADPNFDKPIGTFKNYTDKGILDNVSTYSAESKKTEGTWYYPNGKKKAYMIVDKDGQKKSTGWEPNGAEIKEYILEKTPVFKGGEQGWKRYLEKHVNAKVAIKSDAQAGTHVVLVSFLITKDGYVSEVKATTISEKCKACVAEAISVIQNSPEWEPAIQFNKPVNYRQVQGINFVVQEEKSKRKSK